MPLSDDVHMGLSLGVILALKYFLFVVPLQGGPDLNWTPFFACFVAGVPLMGYGKPLSQYVTIFASGFFSYYTLKKSDYIWAAIYDAVRHYLHIVYDLMIYRGSLGNELLEACPAFVRNFVSQKLRTPMEPLAPRPNDLSPGGQPGFVPQREPFDNSPYSQPAQMPPMPGE